VLDKAKIFHKEISEKGTSLSATLIELKNSYVALLSEGEERLGTLVVSIPTRLEISKLPLSSTLLGERNVMVARLIAERLAAVTKKMVLVSLFVNTMNESQAGRIFMKLLEELLKERGDEG